MTAQEKVLLLGIAVLIGVRLASLPHTDAPHDDGPSGHRNVIGCVADAPCPAVLDAKYGWDPAGFSRPHVVDVSAGSDLIALDNFGLSDTQLAFVYADHLIRRYRAEVKPAQRNCNTRVRERTRRWEQEHTWLIKSPERVLAKLGQLAPPAKAGPIPYTEWESLCDRLSRDLARTPDLLPPEGIKRVALAGRQAKPDMLTPALRPKDAAAGPAMH
ncbi:MAG: hypothetical protein VW268_11040 [Rhodospirillaceae bacterium]